MYLDLRTQMVAPDVYGIKGWTLGTVLSEDRPAPRLVDKAEMLAWRNLV